MESSPEYLSKQHASVIYDLKIRLLENAVRAGYVRAFRIGKKVLIETSSIEEWIRAHEITPADQQAEKSELGKLMDRAIAIARKRTA